MALKKTFTDPLNWLLLLLAAAFVYYIFAVPYFTEFYLKTPQEMTLQEYLASPSHPRPFMLHALSTPPASIEILLTDLTVLHVDQDSILLEDPSLDADATAAPQGETGDGEEGESPAAADVPAEDRAAMPEEVPASEPQAAQEPTQPDEEPLLAYVSEEPTPRNQVLIAGENLDLLGISPGQTVTLRVHGLHESPLGWIPQEVTVAREQEEFFNKDELDAFELLAIIVDGNETTVPYMEVGEFRFASGAHVPGEPMSLVELADDTTYVQTAQRLSGGAVDMHQVRLVDRQTQNRAPFFLVEDDEGRRAQVFYNRRLLSEWYWAMDRLSDQPVVIRGTLRQFAPGQLRELEADGNIQAVLDGYDILSQSEDGVGAQVINLENPAGDARPMDDQPPADLPPGQ